MSSLCQSVLILSFLVLLIACAPQNDQNENPATTADLIVTNVKVAVMNNNNTFAQAITVKDGLVLETGTNEAILPLKNDNKKSSMPLEEH